MAGTDLGFASETYAAVSTSVVDSALSEDMEISSAIGADSDYKLPSPVFGIVGKTDIVPLWVNNCNYMTYTSYNHILWELEAQ